MPTVMIPGFAAKGTLAGMIPGFPVWGTWFGLVSREEPEVTEAVLLLMAEGRVEEWMVG